MINVEKVTRARKHQGRTANWLASRIGVTFVTYSNWVKDGKIPMNRGEREYAESISHALGIPMEDLTDES